MPTERIIEIIDETVDNMKKTLKDIESKEIHEKCDELFEKFDSFKDKLIEGGA